MSNRNCNCFNGIEIPKTNEITVECSIIVEQYATDEEIYNITKEDIENA